MNCKIVCTTVFASLVLVCLTSVYLLDSTKIITLNGEEMGIHHGNAISSTLDKLQATQKHELDKLQATQKHELDKLQATQETKCRYFIQV